MLYEFQSSMHNLGIFWIFVGFKFDSLFSYCLLQISRFLCLATKELAETTNRLIRTTDHVISYIPPFLFVIVIELFIVYIIVRHLLYILCLLICVQNMLAVLAKIYLYPHHQGADTNTFCGRNGAKAGNIREIVHQQC